jgi:hypothetical protein
MAKIATPRRPRWNDVSSYPDHTTWSFSRWAWEFLRRNVEFIAECERAMDDDSPDIKKGVANKFGLRDFKPFNQNFEWGVIPEWLNILPEVLASPLVGVYPIKETVKPGRVVLSFDLNEMLKNRPVLDAQLFNAQVYLQGRLAEFATLNGRAIRSPRPHKSVLFDYLRVYDARVDAKVGENRIIAMELFPDEYGIENDYAGERRVSTYFKRAKEFVESSYLELPAKDYIQNRVTAVQEK